jgi:four helix bundle protein
MAKITRFEDMDIWKEAVRVGVRIYKLSETGKLKNDFSAKDQLKRASISMSNNIAEGFEYNSNNTFQKFLTYAKGSAGELRSELFFLKEADVVMAKDYESLAPELIRISKSIGGFKKYLREFEAKKKKKKKD